MTADVRICQLTSRTWLRKTNRADTITAKVPKRITEVPSDRVFIADICLGRPFSFEELFNLLVKVWCVPSSHLSGWPVRKREL